MKFYSCSPSPPREREWASYWGWVSGDHIRYTIQWNLSKVVILTLLGRWSVMISEVFWFQGSVSKQHGIWTAKHVLFIATSSFQGVLIRGVPLYYRILYSRYLHVHVFWCNLAYINRWCTRQAVRIPCCWEPIISKQHCPGITYIACLAPPRYIFLCIYILISLQDRSSGEILFYMKGADVVMTNVVQYSDWLEEEVGYMYMYLQCYQDTHERVREKVSLISGE